MERADFFAEYDPVNARGKFKPYNPNLGAWGAMTLCRVNASARKIDICFCQLLLRPFSAQALDVYGKLWSPWSPQRLERIWDFRKWDENHGFKLIYDYAVEGALEKKS